MLLVVIYGLRLRVIRGIRCYSARTSGRSPWGGDTARRRRDVTADVTLAVLGAGDRCCGARLGVVACSMVRGLSWGGTAHSSQSAGFAGAQYLRSVLFRAKGVLCAPTTPPTRAEFTAKARACIALHQYLVHFQRLIRALRASHATAVMESMAASALPLFFRLATPARPHSESDE